ncbi:Serpin domain containing protein, partial [Asbolus verrucosus]
PLSAETALAFAQSGCKNGTAQEIRSALHLPDDKDKIEVGIKSFLPRLKGGENYTLQSANKMYVKENFEIKKEFKTAAIQIYQADLENINFEKRDDAALTMNKWVEEQTSNKIQNLIKPSDLRIETRIESVLSPRQFYGTYVNISLPKFKIESNLSFKNILQNLGVHKAFSEEEADLSGIAGCKGDLLIDDVVQKTFIDLNEDGVEAAAATM